VVVFVALMRSVQRARRPTSSTERSRRDYAADEDATQFGVRFETDSDFDGEFDWIVCYASGEDAPRLDIQSLIE
jgi:hypothetical protein